MGGYSRAEDDERFWQEQQRRRQQLGQPCCTQSNMSWSMIDMTGDFCVVIHGESDCLNCFFHHNGQRAIDYYSTRLTEHQLIMGRCGEPLRHLLTLLARERKPEAVIVLGTCPVEVIFDDFEPVVEAVSHETGVPMVALRTHGLGLVSLVSCQDWLYASLAGLEQSEELASEGINLVGLPPDPEHAELRRVLGKLGVEVNGIYPNRTALPEWRRIGHATHSFVVDRRMFPQLSVKLEELGQEVTEVPLPIGPYQTEKLYRELARTLKIDDTAIDFLIEPLTRALDQPIIETAERVRGRRLALCIRMLKTHRADKLAYEGLTELELVRGLGFEVEIMVQGPPEPAARDAFATRIAELGYPKIPFDIFRGPWELGDKLKEGRFDVAIMSDVARNVVEAEGIQMIPSGSFQPWFSGMPANLKLLQRVAESWE